MKRSYLILAVVLTGMIIASGCSHHRARKEMREMHQRMGRFGMMQGMRPGNFMQPHWQGNLGGGPGFGFRGGFGQGMQGIPGMGPMMRGMGRFENIPNLTDKQKKEIADLRDQQREEMVRFREENLAKMKTMMEEHRKKVMSILTDEQKKYLESEKQVPEPSDKK